MHHKVCTNWNKSHYLEKSVKVQWVPVHIGNLEDYSLYRYKQPYLNCMGYILTALITRHAMPDTKVHFEPLMAI